SLGMFGLVNMTTISYDLVLIPAFIMGLVIGDYFFHHLAEKKFHKIVLMLILVIGVTNLACSFM
ncbi:MAG: hypothetical protein ABH950_02635, partial [Candidatus Altiarchaeota archaeon]